VPQNYVNIQSNLHNLLFYNGLINRAVLLLREEM